MTRENMRDRAIDAIANALIYHTAPKRITHPDLNDELKEAVTLFVDEHDEFEDYYEEYGDYISDIVDDYDLMDSVIDHAINESGLDYLSHSKFPLYAENS